MAMTLGTKDRSISETPDRDAPGSPRSRTLVFAGGGVVLALVLLTLGSVMRSNANFAEDYVARQLSEQRITFKPAAQLTPEERKSPCLVSNAGKPLTTGTQAECYANDFIGRHLKSVADGKTYAEMRDVQTSLRTRLADAQARNDPAVADLQRQLNEVTAKRQSLFEGETSRGLLLTSYGFSTLGHKAGEGATTAYLAAGGVLILSLLLFGRAMTEGRRG